MSKVSFECPPGDATLIMKIGKRIASEFPGQMPEGADDKSMTMDVMACHCNGTPLRLKDLLEAEQFDFVHDVMGITRHIDRTTGELADCFEPRFAVR